MNEEINDTLTSLIDISIDFIFLLTQLKMYELISINEYTEHVYNKALFIYRSNGGWEI